MLAIFVPDLCFQLRNLLTVALVVRLEVDQQQVLLFDFILLNVDLLRVVEISLIQVIRDSLLSLVELKQRLSMQLSIVYFTLTVAQQKLMPREVILQFVRLHEQFFLTGRRFGQAHLHALHSVLVFYLLLGVQ